MRMPQLPSLLAHCCGSLLTEPVAATTSDIFHMKLMRH